MKLIFLDIDGVLITHESMYATGGIEPNEHGLYERFDKHCVSVFNEIVEKARAEVVVSSAWRLSYPSVDKLNALLARNGVKCRVVGRTPVGRSFPVRRGAEIDEWLWTNCPRGPLGRIDRPEVWVIIDDSMDMKPHMDKLVRTNWYGGLTRAHLPAIYKHLNVKE